jgi:circadian clock protein KaiB
MRRQKKSFDHSDAFQEAVQNAEPATYRLRLFVSGTTPRSAQAVRNIRDICEQTMQGRYELEVIDIYQHPEAMAPEHVIVTPTLIKKLPLPVRRVIGDLSDTQKVIVGLDIIVEPAV